MVIQSKVTTCSPHERSSCSMRSSSCLAPYHRTAAVLLLFALVPLWTGAPYSPAWDSTRSGVRVRKTWWTSSRLGHSARQDKEFLACAHWRAVVRLEEKGSRRMQHKAGRLCGDSKCPQSNGKATGYPTDVRMQPSEKGPARLHHDRYVTTHSKRASSSNTTLRPPIALPHCC